MLSHPCMTHGPQEFKKFVVPEDGTYLDDRGSPIFFRKGYTMTLEWASQFKDFREEVARIANGEEDEPA